MKKFIVAAMMAAMAVTASAQSLEVLQAFEGLRSFHYLCGSQGFTTKIDTLTQDTLYKRESMTYFFRIPAGFGAGIDPIMKQFMKAKKDKNCFSTVEMEAKVGEEFVCQYECLVPQPDAKATQPTFLKVVTYENVTPDIPRRVLLIHYTVCDDGVIKGMTIDYKYSKINKEGRVKYFPRGYEAESFPSTLKFWRDYEAGVNTAVMRAVAEQQEKKQENIDAGIESETLTILKTYNKLQDIVLNTTYSDKRTDAALGIYLLVKEKKGKLDENEQKFLKSQIYMCIQDLEKYVNHPKFSTALNYLRMAHKLL